MRAGGWMFARRARDAMVVSVPVTVFCQADVPDSMITAGVSFDFPAAAVQWAWDGANGKWMRTQDGAPDVLTDGHQISATNVVIYFVPYITSGLATGEGVAPAPIPEGILSGTGNVWVFSSGHVVKGTWHRPDLTTPATYTDSTGQTIALTPGNTWVELAPVGTVPAITP